MKNDLCFDSENLQLLQKDRQKSSYNSFKMDYFFYI